MKVLVLGSNSFSGASFIKYLLGRPEVRRIDGLSRSEEYNDVFLPYKWVDHAKYTFHQLDLNKDLSGIEALVDTVKPDYVVNFAAQSMVGESWLNPEHWFMTNAVSTVKLHDLLRKKSFLKKYVHITTPEVYGSCSGFVDESFPFNPSTPYAVSRAAGDMSLKTFFQAYQFPVVATRAANVYGPGQQLYRIIPRTILFMLTGRKLKLHGGGVSTRSFIHIDDVSEATWKIAQKGELGETYHISTDRVISIRDLVELISQKLRVNFSDHVEMVGDRIGKDSAYHLSSQKLRTTLGWTDTIGLEAGIDQTIDWIKNNLGTIERLPMDYIHKP